MSEFGHNELVCCLIVASAGEALVSLAASDAVEGLYPSTSEKPCLIFGRERWFSHERSSCRCPNEG